MNAADWVGSIGVGLLLIAFALNLARRVRAGSISYRALNLVGASMACYAAVLIDYVPFVVLEGVWALTAFVAIVRPQRSSTPIAQSSAHRRHEEDHP